jgi:hypothetical protein
MTATKKIVAVPTDAQLQAEAYALLHKVTVEDEVLDKKGDSAELVDDLRLGDNDFIWLSGRLSSASHGYGGSPIFASQISAAQTAGGLSSAYTKAVRKKSGSGNTVAAVQAKGGVK